MRGAVWVELRRSMLLHGALVIALAQLGLMLNDIADWRGVWPMASAAVGAPWIFLGPIAAGLSAFDAMRRFRARHVGASDGGLAWRSETTAMLISRILLVSAVLLLGAACAVAVNLAAGAPAGFLWPSYLVVAIAFAVECVVLGMLLGGVGGPLWFSPLLAVLITFLRALWFQGVSAGSPEAAFIRVFLSGHPWFELNAYAVICAVIETVVVIALALTVPGLMARARARRSGRTYPRDRYGTARMLGGSFALVAALVIVLLSPPILQDQEPSQNPLCSQTQPEVCVWPENALLLPPLAEVANRAEEVADAVDGTMMDQISEYGLGPGDNFLASGYGTWFFSSVLSGSIAHSLAPIHCDPPDGDPTVHTYFRALAEVSALLQLRIESSERPTGYGDTTGINVAEITKIWQGPPTESAAWIKERVAVMQEIAEGWCT